MKIAVSATGKNIESLLDMRFGRCDFFQIHDSENGDFKVVDNKGQSANGAAGIAASQQLIDEKVDVIITGSLGPNAFTIIEKSGIKAYKCGNITIKAALEKLKNNELDEIKLAGPAHNGMGQ